MKKFGLVMALAFVPAVALAQGAPKVPPKDVNLFNCSALRGAPQVCVVNETDFIVTDLDCKRTGFFGGTKLKGVEMPKGGIPPHSLTIVKFPSCKGKVVFTLLGGSDRESGEIDTDQATTLEVPKR